jgi:anti-anti-sigma regulatory factor
VLKVVIDKIGEVAVVECQGRIVKSEASLKLRRVVTSLRDRRIIVLDLSEVTAIEADGLGMLLFLRQWAYEQNIQLKLFNPTTSVLDSLELVIRRFDIVSFHEMLALLANGDSHFIQRLDGNPDRRDHATNTWSAEGRPR